MEKLNLSYLKPLAFIKVQTTGLNPASDRIVELSITRVDVNRSSKNGTKFINPGIEIPEETTNFNGITNDMVKSAPTFKESAQNLSKFLEGCDFVGFNIEKFDLRFLSEEFNRAGVEFTLLGRKVIDIANIYHAMEPRDFVSAYSFYCGKNVEKKDSASITTMYSEILNNMMNKYAGKDYTNKAGKTNKIEATIESINNLFNKNKNQLDIEGSIIKNTEGRPMFAQGKHKHQLIADVMVSDPNYIEWLVDVSQFPADTKLIVKKIVEKAKAAAITK